jgi:hypothetical protein
LFSTNCNFVAFVLYIPQNSMVTITTSSSAYTTTIVTAHNQSYRVLSTYLSTYRRLVFSPRNFVVRGYHGCTSVSIPPSPPLPPSSLLLPISLSNPPSSLPTPLGISPGAFVCPSILTCSSTSPSFRFLSPRDEAGGARVDAPAWFSKDGKSLLGREGG